MRPSRLIALALVAATLIFGGTVASAKEASKVRIAIQRGLTYLPFIVVEQNKLIEKYAAAAGLGDVAVEWTTVSGGGVMNDALLSGSLDYAASGIPAFLTLWDKGKGAAATRAVCGYGTVPLLLVTRNPKVKTIKDFTDADRIAVPTVQASLQAIILKMAAEKAFGPGNEKRLDALTISRGHADAYAALSAGASEVDSHFSAPPYQELELAIPGVHTVMAASDLFRGPVSNGLLYTTVRFHDENPKLNGAVLSALKEAIDFIKRDKKQAAELFLKTTGDKTTVDDIIKQLSNPGVEFTLAPKNVYTIAKFMMRTGALSGKASSWKDVFFPEIHNLPGS